MNIPGSYWGDPEAGIIGSQLYVRSDTPVHSALHEACHYICMDTERRQNLHTNAGGGFDEENGVCYLQICLAEHLPSISKSTLFADMDNWGYSFRLGSTRAWYEQDAEDAKLWLIQRRILNDQQQPTWQIRL